MDSTLYFLVFLRVPSIKQTLQNLFSLERNFYTQFGTQLLYSLSPSWPTTKSYNVSYKGIQGKLLLQPC